MILDKSTVRGIIFDLDGTLYRMRWYMRLLLTKNVYPHILRLPRYMKIRKTFAGKDLKNYSNLISFICKDLASVDKCDENEVKEWIENNFYNAFVKTMHYQKNSRPGINEVLAKVKSNNYKLAVLSDYGKIADRLAILGIDKLNFDILMSSESAGALKPSPRPFIEISDKWQLSPSEVLVIGDRDDTDGIAAKNAGMQFLKIVESSNKKTPDWDWLRIRSFLYELE